MCNNALEMVLYGKVYWRFIFYFTVKVLFGGVAALWGGAVAAQLVICR